MQTDIVIVGAGPTGLMLANQLARRGLKPIIIDRHAGPAQQTRAMAVHARTLEIYSQMGIVEEALKRGARGTGANMWTDGNWTARIPIGDIGKGVSPYPFVLTLGQDENERILGDNLARLGVEIQWHTELVALRQQPSHVDVVLRQPDGTISNLVAAWVAGCDGSRSGVREMCGIGFRGAPYEHTFFVADTVATGPMKPDELNVYLWRDGFHLFFPMPGPNHWRVIGILPQHLRHTDDVTFDVLMPSIKQEAGAGIAFSACSWFSTYRIHHRAADHFRLGRCFLLGDAAHVHSPMGGQGMNTGLQDAYNLAWKMALVVQGRADPALLDSYEGERIPVARRLLETTDRAFQLLVADNWFARLMRTRILARIAARAMTFERARMLAFRTLSQTGISYPDSLLSQSIGGSVTRGPKPGERFPWLHLQLSSSAPAVDLFRVLDDKRFTLLIFDAGGNGAREVASPADEVTVRVIPITEANSRELKRWSIPGTAFYLLRPDGHIGLCGSRVDDLAIQHYLAERVKLTGQEIGEVYRLPPRGAAA